jgi:hypothetical protein
MDESKAAMNRKQRATTAPALEPLEGRALMSAGLAMPTIKEIATKGYTELEIKGTNKGDTITINDNGSNTPGNVSVTLANGTTYKAKGTIAVIGLQGGSGNDNVTFNLTGDLVAPQSVLMNLAGGNNKFVANLAGAINTPNGLDMEVYGGSGNDNFAVNQTGATLAGSFVPYMQGGAGNNTLTYTGTGSIAANASITPEFGGIAGTNTITANYSGQDDGNYIYNLSANGGSGNNTINYNVMLGAGSTGTVGATSSSPAAIEAGKGNNNITFNVHADPTSTATVNAVVVAGTGKNIINHTSNVNVQGTGKKITNNTVA